MFAGRSAAPRGAIARMHRGARFASVSLVIVLLGGGCGSTATAQQHGQQGSAGASLPASGICALDRHARYLKVDIEQDTPVPRCWEARPGQRLRVHNATAKPARLRWKPYAVTTIAPGATVTFDRPFGAYLTPGDHLAHVSTYAGSGFEVYLPTHRHPRRTSAG